MEILHCELFISLLLRMFCLSWAETTLEISVTGAIKTGVGTYVAPVGRMLEFSCRLRRFPNAKLWILRNGEVLLDRTFTGPGIVDVTYQIAGDQIGTTTGNYTCRFYRTITRKGSFAFYYTSENTVEITAFNQDRLPRCASSLGLAGLPGEQTTVFCGSHDGHSPEEEILWRGLSTRKEEYGSYNFYFADILLSNQPSEISCGFFQLRGEGSQDWEEFCSLPTISVLPYMELTMEPSVFSDRNETLKFTCQSSPPSALIRWSIFGHNNNIIDDYYTTKLKEEFTVYIAQGFGSSILEMPSSAIKTDGVHLVTCSTTRENYKMAVSQYEPSNEPTPQTVGGGTKGQSVTKRASSPAGEYSVNTSRESSNAGFIAVIVLLVVVVMVLVIISLWIYRKHRMTIKNDNRLNNYPSVADAGGLSVAQRSATYEPLNRASMTVVAAPPSYADLDVGYSTMGPPSLDEQHYMEPSIASSKFES